LQPLPVSLFVAMQNIVLVTALVLVFTGTNVILQTLPWILTVFEVVSHKTYLGNVRQRCSIGRAWQILLKGHAPPRTLGMDFTTLHIYWLLVQSIRGRHILLTAVGVLSILAELLTVCLSSFGIKDMAFLHSNRGQISIQRGNSMTTSRHSLPSGSPLDYPWLF